MPETRGRALAYGAALLVLALDRITKLLIESRVAFWETLTVIPGFCDIVHTANRGAAFSMFAGADSAWRDVLLAGISAAAVILLGVLVWRAGPERLGLALAMGGAAGNLYDRIAHGAVTDFLDLHAGSYHWPAFNLADSAITVGAGLVILELWRARRNEGKG